MSSSPGNLSGKMLPLVNQAKLRFFHTLWKVVLKCFRFFNAVSIFTALSLWPIFFFLADVMQKFLNIQLMRNFWCSLKLLLNSLCLLPLLLFISNRHLIYMSTNLPFFFFFLHQGLKPALIHLYRPPKKEFKSQIKIQQAPHYDAGSSPLCFLPHYSSPPGSLLKYCLLDLRPVCFGLQFAGAL